jgi:hypothetical protein
VADEGRVAAPIAHEVQPIPPVGGGDHRSLVAGLVMTGSLGTGSGISDNKIGDENFSDDKTSVTTKLQ